MMHDDLPRNARFRLAVWFCRHVADSRPFSFLWWLIGEPPLSFTWYDKQGQLVQKLEIKMVREDEEDQ